MWFRLSRPMTLGVRAIVENSDGEVLFVRHTYTKGLFFPGGGVERGETAEVSLVRELEEEAQVQVTGKAALLGIYSNHQYFRNDHVLLYRIAADAWTQAQSGRLNTHEISEIVWADPLAAPQDVTPGTARRLKEVYQATSRSAFW